MSKPQVELFLPDARGIYIPRDFTRIIRREMLFGVSNEALAVLEDPDDHFYWEVWTDVMDNGFIFQPSKPGWEYDQDIMTALTSAHAADKLGNAAVRDEFLARIPGTKYNLYQDNDLFLVPDGMEWNDRKECFFWPEDQSDE